MDIEKVSEIKISGANEMYNEVIDRIKSITNGHVNEDVSTWVLSKSTMGMCFVGDMCPKRYREDVLKIITEVESTYSK